MSWDAICQESDGPHVDSMNAHGTVRPERGAWEKRKKRRVAVPQGARRDVWGASSGCLPLPALPQPTKRHARPNPSCRKGPLKARRSPQTLSVHARHQTPTLGHPTCISATQSSTTRSCAAGSGPPCMGRTLVVVPRVLPAAGRLCFRLEGLRKASRPPPGSWAGWGCCSSSRSSWAYSCA